eukprot:6049045-Amphidinium_carterae.1
MDGMPFARIWQVRAIKGLLECPPVEVVKRRSNMLQVLIQRISEFKEAEARLRNEVPQHVERIMKGKR